MQEIDESVRCPRSSDTEFDVPGTFACDASGLPDRTGLARNGTDAAGTRDGRRLEFVLRPRLNGLVHHIDDSGHSTRRPHDLGAYGIEDVRMDGDIVG